MKSRWTRSGTGGASGSGTVVLGVYLLAHHIEDAEEHAEQFCRRALPTFADWEPVSAQVPLIGPFYEGLLSASSPAGRNGPRTIPST